MNRRTFIIDAFKTLAVAIVAPVVILEGSQSVQGNEAYWTTAMLVDVKNGNGRLYPKDVMEKALVEYKKKIADKTTLGVFHSHEHFDYSPEINLQEVSHIVTEADINFANELRVSMEVLHTSRGRQMIAWQKRFGADSIEFRCSGMGSIKEVDGVTVIQDDYQLLSIDAYPTQFAAPLRG